MVAIQPDMTFDNPHLMSKGYPYMEFTYYRHQLFVSESFDILLIRKGTCVASFFVVPKLPKKERLHFFRLFRNL